jgi:hypothetical protein
MNDREDRQSVRIGIGRRNEPAAMREVAARVLAQTAGGLHDAINGQECR